MIPTNLDPMDQEERERLEAERQLAAQQRERFEEAPDEDDP